MNSSATIPDARVDADWIAAHLNDPFVRIIEIDVSAAAYKAGHIPGAVLWNAYTDLRDAGYVPVRTAELQELLREAGVSPDTTLVFYGYGAHLGFWLLTAYGHKRLRLMDGSRDQWIAGGRTWSTEVPVYARSQYVLPEPDAYSASKERVLEMIGRQEGVLLDTRSKLEFDGEYFWPSGATAGAGRAGHLPGAVHLPIELLRTNEGNFLSVDEMMQVMREHGIPPEAKIVTYCTIGNRASQAWFALMALLGYRDVEVYYGSWAEWGKTDDLPIVT